MVFKFVLDALLNASEVLTPVIPLSTVPVLFTVDEDSSKNKSDSFTPETALSTAPVFVTVDSLFTSISLIYTLLIVPLNTLLG